MERKGTFFIGVVLILIGIFLFIANIGIIDISIFWPLIPLAIGIALMLAFAKGHKEPSLLFVGLVLSIVSILFQYCSVSGWEMMSSLWPIFLLAVGCGFLAEYFFVGSERTRLSMGLALLTTAAVLLLINYYLGKFWPVLLILLGIFFVATSTIRKSMKG